MSSLLLIAFTSLLTQCGGGDDTPSDSVQSGGGGGDGDSGGSDSGGNNSGASDSGGNSSGGNGSGGDSEGTLSEEYPGDVGMADDPAVVWMENFEAGSVGEVLSRYDDHKNPAGMSLVADVPAESSGNQALLMLASGAQEEATDFYKNFGENGYEEWYVRWYVKYVPGSPYHHTGVWFGGYNPPLDYPYPRAGTRPSGDDLFHIALEAISDRFDFYNYWMRMHSWSASEESFWGNTLVHDQRTIFDDQWHCVEVHSKVNSDLSSSAGAELALWIDDAHIATFSETEGYGYWVADKFCLEDADHSSCTDYPPTAGEDMIPLDLQVRDVEALKLNYFWPENFSTEGEETSVWYDDMVIATRRIGCIQIE